MLNFAVLRAPAGNGETLVEPPAPTLADRVADNRQLLAGYAFDILGMPASRVRRATREALGLPPDGVVIATGHQPELIHAGVWAKHVVTRRLADALGGTGLNLVVDNDAPKSETVAVPGRRGENAVVERIAIPGLRTGYAYEYRPALSAEQVAALRTRVAAVMQNAFPVSRMPAYFDAWSGAADRGDLVDQLITTRQAAESPFGSALVERRVSSAWPNALAGQVLLDASRFATAYNAALAEYRRANGVREANRPMPDLARRGEVVEVPLWVYGPDEPRRRLFVRPRGATVELLADTEPFGRIEPMRLRHGEPVEAALAGVAPRVIRPRALMLTLWARLFVADLFVHGIGGAKYDRITDVLIARYFDVQPPAMACVSATLRLPLPRRAVGIEDLRAARRRQRDWRYNPQRYVQASASVAKQVEHRAATAARQVARRAASAAKQVEHRAESAAKQVERRAAAIVEQVERRAAAIARSEALRAREPANRRARAAAFREIHAANEALTALDPSMAKKLARDVEQTRSALAANRVALSREYFFGLFPDAALQALCDALPATAALKPHA